MAGVGGGLDHVQSLPPRRGLLGTKGQGGPVWWEADTRLRAKSVAKLDAQGEDPHKLSGTGVPSPDLERLPSNCPGALPGNLIWLYLSSATGPAPVFATLSLSVFVLSPLCSFPYLSMQNAACSSSPGLPVGGTEAFTGILCA